MGLPGKGDKGDAAFHGYDIRLLEAIAESSAPLIQANFAANQIVDRYFALDPAKGLAMSVIGNPMVLLIQISQGLLWARICAIIWVR